MTILVAIDFSEVTDSVINAIPQIAHFDDVIHILYVCEPNPEFVGFDVGPSSVNDQLNEEFEQQKIKMSQFTSILAKKGYTVKTVQVNGVIADEVIDYAKKVKSKMIMLGRHGHSAIYNILVGSVAEEVLKHSPIPVVLVPK